MGRAHTLTAVDPRFNLNIWHLGATTRTGRRKSKTVRENYKRARRLLKRTRSAAAHADVCLIPSTVARRLHIEARERHGCAAMCLSANGEKLIRDALQTIILRVLRAASLVNQHNHPFKNVDVGEIQTALAIDDPVLFRALVPPIISFGEAEHAIKQLCAPAPAAPAPA